MLLVGTVSGRARLGRKQKAHDLWFQVDFLDAPYGGRTMKQLFLRDARFSTPIQGYLAHKKLLPCLGPPQGPRNIPTLGS